MVDVFLVQPYRCCHMMEYLRFAGRSYVWWGVAIFAGVYFIELDGWSRCHGKLFRCCSCGVCWRQSLGAHELGAHQINQQGGLL